MAQAQSKISILFNTLLTNFIIKTGRTQTAATCHGIATRNYARVGFIIRVLEGGEDLQQHIYDACVASDSDGQHHLADLLRVFFTLSADKKAKFIVAYKSCQNVAAEGLMDVVGHRVYEEGHIPPRLDP